MLLPVFLPGGPYSGSDGLSILRNARIQRRTKSVPSIIVELVMIAVMFMPFFLPKMHERYFYPADVLSVAFAFYCPRLFYIPVLIEEVSFFSYQPFLFERQPIPTSILTAVLLIVIGILFYQTAVERYSSAGQGKPTNSAFPTDQPADAVK